MLFTSGWSHYQKVLGQLTTPPLNSSTVTSCLVPAAVLIKASPHALAMLLQGSAAVHRLDMPHSLSACPATTTDAGAADLSWRRTCPCDKHALLGLVAALAWATWLQCMCLMHGETPATGMQLRVAACQVHGLSTAAACVHTAWSALLRADRGERPPAAQRAVRGGRARHGRALGRQRRQPPGPRLRRCRARFSPCRVPRSCLDPHVDSPSRSRTDGMMQCCSLSLACAIFACPLKGPASRAHPAASHMCCTAGLLVANFAPHGMRCPQMRESSHRRCTAPA